MRYDGGLVIGMDGGGTHTRAAAMRPDGSIAARAKGLGLNFHTIGLEAARNNLWAVVRELRSICDEPIIRIVVGMSALERDAEPELTKQFAGDIPELELFSDAQAALMGVAFGEPAAVVICGTGSIIMVQGADGRRRVSLGWGTVLGDPGSAYAMAVDGLRESIRSWECGGDATALCRAVMQYFDINEPRDLRELIERIYHPPMPADRIAGFGQEVLRLAAEGDESAQRIVHNNLDYAARACAALLADVPEANRVGLYGGVLMHNKEAREWFTRRLLELKPGLTVGLLAVPPEVGAVLYSLKRQGRLTESVIARACEDSRGWL
ncbi:N-acetylglucosamine kinase [Clostridia bacterium]|nr:N-acetylglucosamine kinase [Clostridia bacterium]